MRIKLSLLASIIMCLSGLQFAIAQSSPNQLTRAENISGWQLLFDGKSADNFRNYKKDGLSSGWKIEDGAMVRADRGAGDIVTKEKYKYFELSLEYKIAPEGNSGIMFHVAEGDGPPWHTGPEIQVQDNAKGHDPQLSGWLYQLYTPGKDGDKVIDATRPAGQWNQVFLRISPQNCEVCLNGVRYYTFKLGDKVWDERVAKSKFATLPKFGKAGEGHICLQDHNDLVSYRNIKVRRLNDDGSLPKAPVDGKLNVSGKAAFPKLKWEGYEPVDEDGKVAKQLRILELTYAKGIPHRLFAAAQNGVVYTFENKPDVEQASMVLDLRDKVSKWWTNGANEQGLLGLGMHPKFKENGQFFVSYTALADDKTVVSRFKVSKDNPLKADPTSEEVIFETAQPFKNHNGGAIEFGPDGYLYIALGDGGLRNDPHSNGENLGTLLGSILRIDVDKSASGKKYAIPADNPFVSVAGAQPEIFAFGFRNPWRIAFDKATGKLWCGDVGQELWEEIDIIEKGGNHGWSSREGSKPFSNRTSHEKFPPREPIWEYDHGVGKSITGGRVYRSSRLPQLNGKYVYADYVSGGVWALGCDHSAGKATSNEEIAGGGIPVLAFGEDESGEVYYMTDNGFEKCIFKFESN
jgi:glucose/arabinose dehydrogenase